MKKINVLDLLCDDFIKQYEEEKNNLSICVNKENIDKNVKVYIIPYLEQNYKLFDLDFKFNINAEDEIVKYKSLFLLCDVIKGVYDLISSMPNFFKKYEEDYNTQVAYEEICLRVLIGNILDYKKELNKVDNIIIDTFKEDLDEIKNIIDNS